MAEPTRERLKNRDNEAMLVVLPVKKLFAQLYRLRLHTMTDTLIAGTRNEAKLDGGLTLEKIARARYDGVCLPPA